MIVRLFGIVLAASVALTLGCGGDHDDHDHEGHDHEGHDHDADEQDAGLSAADQALVKAQKICPVSDEELGSMGTPVKETWEGQTVFFCCEACRKPFKKDPAKYMAKLKKTSK